MKLGIAQVNPIVGNIQANFQKIEEYVKRGESYGVDLVVFPELCITGYPPEDLILREYFVDENLVALNKAAKLSNRIAIIVGFIEREKEKKYNSLAFISNGKIEKI